MSAPGDEGELDALYRYVRKMRGAGPGSGPGREVSCLLWRPDARGGSVYLVQRAASQTPWGGVWTGLGGPLEEGDGDGAAAAVRWVRHQTGLEVGQDTDFTLLGRWMAPATGGRDTEHYLLAVGAGHDPDFRRSGGSLVAAAWMRPDQVLSQWEKSGILLAPPLGDLLAALRRGREDAVARCRAALDSAGGAGTRQRWWELLPGIAMVPLRTPTLPPATHTNCYLIGSGEVVVVDPGSPYADEQEALEEVIDALVVDRGRRVVQVRLTHHHQDHVGGAARLADRLGVPLAAHRETARRLGALEVAIDLQDGETTSLAGQPRRHLVAVFTPGHAPGHHCFWERDTRSLFAGDMMAGLETILIDPSEGDMSAYLASLSRIKALAPRLVLPAHGGAIVDAQARIEATARHRAWREGRIAQALAARGQATARELVLTAYDDVEAALHPLAERSLTAHLVKLAADGRARRQGDYWISLE